MYLRSLRLPSSLHFLVSSILYRDGEHGGGRETAEEKRKRREMYLQGTETAFLRSYTPFGFCTVPVRSALEFILVSDDAPMCVLRRRRQGWSCLVVIGESAAK